MADPSKSKPLTVQSLAAEGQEGFQTTQLGKRLERYGKARENAVQFAGYLRSVDELGLAANLDDCGNFATFRDYFTIGQIRLSRICTCKKHLLCPLCAIRRGAKALRVYHARVEAVMASDASLRPYMVTFTVKNGDDLTERFKHLAGKLRAYHKRRKGQRQKGEVRKAHSAVWSYEFTNRGNGWHPHVHSVWLCSEAPDSAALSQEWHELTGDSFIVDVRPIRPGDDGSLVDGFCEVFKYAIKFADLANSDRLHAYRELKGKRLQDSFGELRGLNVEPGDSDDLLEELPYIERLYRFVSGQGYVLQSETDSRDDDDRMMQSLIDQGWTDEKIVAFMQERAERLAA